MVPVWQVLPLFLPQFSFHLGPEVSQLLLPCAALSSQILLPISSSQRQSALPMQHSATIPSFMRALGGGGNVTWRQSQSLTCRILNQKTPRWWITEPQKHVTHSDTPDKAWHDSFNCEWPTHTHMHTHNEHKDRVCAKALLTQIMTFYDVGSIQEKLCDRAGTTVYVLSVT